MSPLNVFYCKAVNSGGALCAPLDADEVPDYLSGPLPETLPPADGIAAAKQALRDSFSDALRAN